MNRLKYLSCIKHASTSTIFKVSLSAYLNANNLDSTMNANANRNIAAAMAHAASKKEAIPEDGSLQLANDLPPTIKLLVFLWDEIKSYCIQAILQQLIVASPLALQGGAASLAPLASTTSKRDKDRGSSKSRKRKSREEHQLYMDPKGNIID